MILPNIIIDTIKRMRGEKEKIQIPIQDSKAMTFYVYFLFIFCLISIIGIIGLMIYTFLHRHTGF